MIRRREHSTCYTSDCPCQQRASILKSECLLYSRPQPVFSSAERQNNLCTKSLCSEFFSLFTNIHIRVFLHTPTYQTVRNTLLCLNAQHYCTFQHSRSGSCAVYNVGLWPLACWECGISRSLFQGSCTECIQGVTAGTDHTSGGCSLC